MTSFTVAEDTAITEDTPCNVSCIQKVDCSLHCALQEANSHSNVIINITTNVTLSSVIPLTKLNNIMIVGHNNPTVTCNNTGALQFESCSNLVMEGINWEGCGTANSIYTSPALDIKNCSAAKIRNCSFKFSTGQSLVLNNILGKAVIDHCKFTHNSPSYNGHGAAINYHSSVDENLLTMNNCTFLNNNGKSVVYTLGNSRYEKCLYLQDSNFSLNQAVPLYIVNHKICIDGYVTFKSNQAQNGGGIFISGHAKLNFNHNSHTTFSNNTANTGSAIYATDNADVVFNGRSAVTIMDNNAIDDGTLYSSDHTNITFAGESTVSFINNRATQGGAIYHSNSNVTITSSAKITFNNNKATLRGGAVYSRDNSYFIIKENSSMQFIKNQADFGGAVYTTISSHAIFQDNSVAGMYKNMAFAFGGAIYLYSNSNVVFKGNSDITFERNRCVRDGGAIYVFHNSSVTIIDNPTVLFNSNSAICGGAVLVSLESAVLFKGDLISNITFIRNNGRLGGAIFVYYSSTVAFKRKASAEFRNNNGRRGGAIYSRNSSIIFDEQCTIKFDNNTANDGGVLYSQKSTTNITGNSSVTLHNNRASRDGGVLYLTRGSCVIFTDHCDVNFSSNVADDYGGVVYINHDCKVVINDATTSINFHNNKAAKTNNSFYINVENDCNDTCLNSYIVTASNKSLQYITTSANRLVLRDPAKCIDGGSDTQCDKYYINGIMLGQEININGCVMDYYNQSTETTRLLDINSYNESCDISDNVIISCNQNFQGISVTSRNISRFILPSNISMSLMLHFDRKSEANSILLNLTVELSPCHPGFVYDATSQKCECYNANDIVLCSGSTSMIKRGYWFGIVDEKPTVAYCPINYCNFTCCEATNGFYHLSPVRKNQCTLHRDGIACGNCEEGYTLSFDSAKCIEVERCTASQKSLIIIFSMLYWIVVVMVVFFLMHYQVAIGYFYVIIYYYSMLDLLLSHMHNVYLSEELYTTVSIISSIATVIPKFLGQLCLVENLDVIDQQFIHYIHPFAISIILVMISLLAKWSYKVSSFISKDIIRVICLLLLLSYTSVAVTSLLILQPLKFLDVGKVYTYLSPEIQYFHGRHLAYGLVAIICTIVIAIGLPLLLLAEPFLNSKISFVKIKPFLDQFQGCYRNQYRWFAGYYMICRLITIIIIIIDSSTNGFYGRYILIIIHIIMALIHIIVKPYANNVLNVFDGVVLHLMIFAVSALDPYCNSVTLTVCTILIMPMILFCIMELYVYRKEIKKLVMAVVYKSRSNTHNMDKTDSHINSFDLVIGDTIRMSRGTTVCEM